MRTVLTIALLCSACFGQGVKSTAPLPNDPNGVKSAEPLPNDSAAVLSLAVEEPRFLVIAGTRHVGDFLVKIDMQTGVVEFGRYYDLDETARTFWTALGHKLLTCTEPTGKPDSEKPERKLP